MPLLSLSYTRVLAPQSPELYGPNAMRSPRVGEVTAALRTAAQEVASLIERGDQGAFTALFEGGARLPWLVHDGGTAAIDP